MWPPPKLVRGVSYDEYNDRVMEELKDDPRWKAYVAWRDAARAGKAGDAPDRPYPNAVVCEAQEKVEKAASADPRTCAGADRLAAVEALTRGLASLGLGLAERPAEPTAMPPVKRGDCRDVSGAGEPSAAPAAKRPVAEPVDPDRLIGAFEAKFRDVFGSIYDAVYAVRTSTAFVGGRPDANASLDEAQAARLAVIANAHVPGLRAAYEAAAAERAALDRELAAASGQAAGDQAAAEEELKAKKRRMHAIDEGYNEASVDPRTGSQRTIARLGIGALERTIAENDEAKIPALKQDLEERLKPFLDVLRYRKKRVDETIEQARVNGVPRDAAMARLWTLPGMAWYRAQRPPGGMQSTSDYEVMVRRKEEDLKALEKRTEGMRAKLERLRAEREALASAVAGLEARLDTHALRAKVEATLVNLRKATRALANALPMTAAQGHGLAWVDQRKQWNALVRAFHANAAGAPIVEGRATAGELVNFEDAGSADAQAFDVVVIPFDRVPDAVRIVGVRWCSDDGFVSSLRRMAKTHGLSGAYFSASQRAATNLQRTWRVEAPASEVVGVEAACRAVAFGVAVEVAARDVRRRLGSRAVASTPTGSGPVRGFESSCRVFCDLLGWEAPVTSVAGFDAGDGAGNGALRQRLIDVLARAGAFAEQGPPGRWLGARAAALARGGYTRQLASVLERDEDHGLATVLDFGVRVDETTCFAAVERLLQRYDVPNSCRVFGALHPRLITIPVRQGPPEEDAELVAFVRSADATVALIKHLGAFQVLHKQGRTMWLYDPKGADPAQLKKLKERLVGETARAGGGAFDAVQSVLLRREVPVGAASTFLTAYSRALLMALAARRSPEEAPHGVLGASEAAAYDATTDAASATSAFDVGFGPLCVALAVITHDAVSSERPLGRPELWGAK